MFDPAKEALLAELKELLDNFNNPSYMRNATVRDHARISARIKELCDILDNFDKGGR